MKMFDFKAAWCVVVFLMKTGRTVLKVTTCVICTLSPWSLGRSGYTESMRASRATALGG